MNLSYGQASERDNNYLVRFQSELKLDLKTTGLGLEGGSSLAESPWDVWTGLPGVNWAKALLSMKDSCQVAVLRLQQRTGLSSVSMYSSSFVPAYLSVFAFNIVSSAAVLKFLRCQEDGCSKLRWDGGADVGSHSLVMCVTRSAPFGRISAWISLRQPISSPLPTHVETFTWEVFKWTCWGLSISSQWDLCIVVHMAFRSPSLPSLVLA